MQRRTGKSRKESSGRLDSAHLSPLEIQEIVQEVNNMPRAGNFTDFLLRATWDEQAKMFRKAAEMANKEQRVCMKRWGH